MKIHKQVTLADGTKLILVTVVPAHQIEDFIPATTRRRRKLVTLRQRIKSGPRKGRYRKVRAWKRWTEVVPARPILVKVPAVLAWVPVISEPRHKRPVQSWMSVVDYQQELIEDLSDDAEFEDIEVEIFRQDPDSDLIETNTRFVWYRDSLPFDKRMPPPIGRDIFRVVRIWFVVAEQDEDEVTYSLWCRSALLEAMTDWYGLRDEANGLYAQVIKDLLEYSDKKTYKFHAVATEAGLVAWTGFVGAEKLPHRTTDEDRIGGT